MSKQTKPLREAVSLVLQAQSEELKEGAGSKAKATELNEKIDAILNRIFMERSREIIQKLSESDLAKSKDGEEEDDGELLTELDGLQLDEIKDIEDEADADGGDMPPEEGDDLGGDEDLDGLDLDAEGDEEAVDPEDDDIDFGDLKFGDEEDDGMSADAGDEAGDDDLDALGDEEEITDEEITQ